MDNIVKEQINNIKDDISEIKKDISTIKDDTAENKINNAILTKSVVHHIKRTDDLQIIVEEFKKHMLIVNTAIKIIIATGGVLVFLKELGFLSRWF